MEQNLLILPFDHRSSFSRDILGIQGKLSEQDILKIKDLKSIVYDGFELSVNEFVKEKHQYTYPDFGILVDQVYGDYLIRKAKRLGAKVAIPVEKSGKAIFEFTYGDDFGLHIANSRPDYVKALVRYNPRNTEDNKLQLDRLATLSDFCIRNKYKLLFELLVPATPEDLAEAGNQLIYDTKLRHILTAQAIKEIVKKVKVAVWKVEGLEAGQWEPILKLMSEESKVIVLGRAASDAQLLNWLTVAVKHPKIIGFAIGRSIFNDPLVKYVKAASTRAQAANDISLNFNKFIKVWHDNRVL